MTMMQGRKYYSIEEAATLAGVSVRTLRRWIADGRLTDFLFSVRVGTNSVLYGLEPPDGKPVEGGDADEGTGST